MSKKIICALLALIMLIGLVPVAAVPVSAKNGSGSCGTGLTYKVEGTTLTIEGSGTMSDFGLPGAANEAPWNKLEPEKIETVVIGSGVKNIGKNAFFPTEFTALGQVQIKDLAAWCGMVFSSNPLVSGANLVVDGKLQTEVEIPKGVTKIAPFAFEGSNFKKVTLPSGVTTIGEGAFSSMDNLSEIVLPDTLTTISSSAFQNDISLAEIKMPNSVTTVGGNAFNGCKALSSVKFSSKLETIGASAFAGTGLKKAELPKSLTSLGSSAFKDCNALASVKLPEKLTTLKSNTFANCSSLVEITIPKAVTSIEGSVFTGCIKLEKVNAEDLSAWLKITFGSPAPLQQAENFYVGGKELKDNNLVIPDDITNIHSNAFAGCRNITSVTLNPFVQKIDNNAFYDCINITDVYLDTQVHWDKLMTNIGSGNENLTGAKIHVKSGGPSIPGFPANGDKKDVSDDLVNMVTGIVPFRADAYETYKGSGKYLIGYGTPANKGNKISQDDAKMVLREYLMIAAASVKDKYTSLTEKSAQLDALAAFTFHNGTSWLSGSPLKTSVDDSAHKDFLKNIVASSSSTSQVQLNSRMCEAYLFLEGKYSSTAPKAYAYVRLDPNTGIPSSFGTVQTYDRNVTTPISTDFDPSRPNYTFVGWFTAKEGGSLVNTLDATTNTATLYAHWQKTGAGLDGDKIVGTKVNYRLPAYMATSNSRDSFNRIKVMEQPVEDMSKSVQVGSLNADEIMDVVAEYRLKTGSGTDLWVRVKNSGWVNLGKMDQAVEAGSVTLGKAQRLEVYESADVTSAKKGSLRNGDAVSVFDRKTVGKEEWAQTVFLDADTDTYETGWIKLKYVKLNGTAGGNGTPEPEEEDKLGPVIAKAKINYTKDVNIRRKADPTSTKVGTAKPGAKFDVYAYKTYIGKKWAQVGEDQWICMDYLQITEDKVEPPKDTKPTLSGEAGSDTNTEALASGNVVANVSLNVRKGPGPQYAKVGKPMTDNARLDVYQTKMANGVQWGRIGTQKWVCMSYVHLDGDAVITGPAEGSGDKEENKSLGMAVIANCATHVNVRATASAGSALQGIIPLGKTVELLEETHANGHDWYRTDKGWICGLYVRKIATPVPGVPVAPAPGTSVPGASGAKTGTVVGEMDLNVRVAPGVYNDKVTTLRLGSRVNVYEEKMVDGALWYKIDQGWVAGKYVQLGQNVAGQITGTTETAKGQHATGTVASAGKLVSRTGPGMGYAKSTEFAPGTVLTIYEQRYLDGINWGHTTKGPWVNLAFITMNSTGITGTGALGTVARCNHAVNLRSGPGFGYTRIGTLLLGAPVEILETQELANGETWGRTTQGWVSMGYIQLAEELPVPPVPQPQPETKPEDKPEAKPDKPSDQGIPFAMKATMNKDANLLMIPGILADYDATIGNGKHVQINKLERVDDELWVLIEGGWVNLKDVDLDTHVIADKAQLVYQDASLNKAVDVLNQNEMVAISDLVMDNANKVWGKVTKGWIELTNIVQPESLAKAFLVKGTVNAADVTVRKEATKNSDQVGDLMQTGDLVTITDIRRDEEGRQWVQIQQGWIRVEHVTVNSSASLPKVLVKWEKADMNKAVGVMNQGETCTISEIALNVRGVAMAKISTGEWIELSGITAP